MDVTYLRVSGDTHDTSLPHMNFGFVHCGNFQEIESRGIQKQERNEGEYPDRLMNTRDCTKLPELHTIISMVDEVDLTNTSTQWGERVTL